MSATPVPDAQLIDGFPEARRDEIAALLRAYEAGLGLSLAFQGFDAELAGLPGPYAPPDGAFVHALRADRVVAIAALRALDRSGGSAEMKRLYVDPAARGTGLGRRLAEHVLAMAARLGYRRVVLDTLPSMRAAQALYATLGFRATAAYNANPVPGTLFLERLLAGGRP